MEPLASAPLASWEVEEWRRVAMVILIQLPQGIWEGGHDPCPSPPEKRRSVTMATPIPLPEGRRMPLSMPPPREKGEWRSVAITTLVSL